MKTFETEEQQDGSHKVIKGRIGQYGPGDVIPAHMALQMRAGRDVDMGNGYVMKSVQRRSNSHNG